MSRSHFVQCEALDARRMFTNMNYNEPGPGNIAVYGSNDVDDIRIWQTNGVTYVTSNGYAFAPITWAVTGVLLKGAAGDDTLEVSMNTTVPVTIWGNDGNDSINASNGPDTIYGNDGNDYIDGNNGDDVIYGGIGNDALIGGSGNDDLWGGDGNDALKGESGSDEFHGDAGVDKVDYSYMSTRIKVDLDNNADDGAASGNTSTEFDNVFNDCEWIIGGAGNDTIDASYITANSVTIIGGGGNDTVAGGAWNDYIDGGTGTDYVVASGGTDTILNVP